MWFFDKKEAQIARKLLNLTLKRVKLNQRIQELEQKLLALHNVSSPDMYSFKEGKVFIKERQSYVYDTERILNDIKQRKLEIDKVIDSISLNGNKLHSNKDLKEYFKGLRSKLVALTYIKGE